MRYKYLGTSEVHIPEVGKTVMPGDIIETQTPINHTDFVQVTTDGTPDVDTTTVPEQTEHVEDKTGTKKKVKQED